MRSLSATNKITHKHTDSQLYISVQICYGPAPNRQGHKAMMLSVAYIGPKSRTERPRKTKIGTEVAHVTRDSDTTFNVKRSKVKVTRLLCLPPCWCVRRLQRWAWERVGRGKLLLPCRLLGGARRFGAHGRRRGGAYRGGRPPAAC